MWVEHLIRRKHHLGEMQRITHREVYAEFKNPAFIRTLVNENDTVPAFSNFMLTSFFGASSGCNIQSEGQVGTQVLILGS